MYKAQALTGTPRRLRYFGRWTEPTRALTFTEANGYALASSTGGGGPEGGW